MMITLIDKNDIMKLTGYSKSQAEKLVREAKVKLFSKGFNWYSNKRVGRVPLRTIEEILGFELSSKNGIIASVQEDTALEKGVSNGSN